MLGVVILILVVFFCFTFYLLHHPIPGDTADFRASLILSDFFGLFEVLADISEFLGYSRWAPYSRFPYIKLISPEGMKVEDVSLAGVECRVFISKEFQTREYPGPAIVHYHGGGWTIGNVESYSMFLAHLAQRSGLVVMSPEFRKAPKFPFPIPYEDCLHSTLEFFQQAATHNVDPHKIIISGDSSGSNIAMAVVMTMQKMKDIPYTPKMLCLIYPALQMIDLMLPSYRQNSNYVLLKNLIPKFWLSYMGFDGRPELVAALANNEHVDPNNPEVAKQLELVNEDKLPTKFRCSKYKKHQRVSGNRGLDASTRSKIQNLMLDERMAPLMASDESLAKLPFTYIVACGYDPLRDDSILLSERLQNLGKSHKLQYLPKSLHATVALAVIGEAPETDKEISEMFDIFKQQLED